MQSSVNNFQSGETLKADHKRKQNPFTAPKTADEWEPYFGEELGEVSTLRRKRNDAEAEINDPETRQAGWRGAAG